MFTCDHRGGRNALWPRLDAGRKYAERRRLLASLTPRSARLYSLKAFGSVKDASKSRLALSVVTICLYSSPPPGPKRAMFKRSHSFL